MCCVAGSEEINSDEDLLAVLSGGKKRIEPIKEEATSLDDPSEPETKDTKPETNKEAAKSVKVTFAFLYLYVSKLPLFLILFSFSFVYSSTYFAFYSLLKVNVEQLLFEVAAEDFGDILAELKATHAGLVKLLGGVAKNVC